MVLVPSVSSPFIFAPAASLGGWPGHRPSLFALGSSLDVSRSLQAMVSAEQEDGRPKRAGFESMDACEWDIIPEDRSS